MKTLMYKETGGINWCLCKVIAEYDNKIWLHNLHTGSMPMKRKSSFEFEEVDEHLSRLLKSNTK